MNEVKFLAEVKDGKLKITNPRLFNLYIGSLKGKVWLKVKRYRKARTTGAPGEKSNMNGYYWLYLTAIATETGDNENDLHEYFKRALLPPRFKTVMKKQIKLPATTTELTGLEMMNYMEKINALTGIPIPPHPDEQIN